MQASSKAADLDAVKWYVLTAFKKEKVAKEALETENIRREKVGQSLLEFFIPMYFDLKGPEAHRKRKKCPLLPNYVFIHASLNDIYAYKQTADYLKFFRPVVENGRRDYLSVPNRQMEDFIQVARHYEA